MANLIKEQRIVDTNKRALLKYVFIADGSGQEANTILVNPQFLAFAMNANNYIMSSNTHPKSSYRTTIKRVFGQAKANGYFKLQWQNSTNSEILTVTTGNFDYDFQSMGDGAVIFNPETAANSRLLISTTGLVNNDVMTLFVDLRKNSEDYDSGQTADPGAFNWNKRGVLS
jgi:hypothetical protein